MIQSLDKGIKMLFILSERKSAGVTELAKELQVNKSTSFRLLQTLGIHSLVEQDAVTGKYKLGPGVLRISERLVNSFDVIAAAKPFLQKLAETTQESAHLCVYAGEKAFIVDQVISSEPIKATAKIGRPEPFHCSAVGKCLLAFRTEKEREKIFNSMEWTAFTKKTMQSKEALESCLEKIRTGGYALDDEELTPGVRCVAAPVYNHKGEVYSCVGISGPATRVLLENIENYTDIVKKSADIISASLGYKS